MYSSTLSLTSALDRMGGQRHASAALPPGKKLSTSCIGGWVGPRAGLDRRGKSPHSTGIRSPDRPIRRESLSEYVILIAFPLQQWLHERASMLHYTYAFWTVQLEVFYSCSGRCANYKFYLYSGRYANDILCTYAGKYANYKFYTFPVNLLMTYTTHFPANNLFAYSTLFRHIC